MKYVECVHESASVPLTKGKIYEVIYFQTEWIRIINDHGNQEFFQNIVDYMMGDNSVLDIRSRQIEIKKIDKEKIKQHAGYYKIVNLLAPIGSILILAFGLNLIRKKRFAQNPKKR
jgi:ABC-type uncharacterized transport system involved in gliding motility auxiliary subunit